MNHQGSRQGEDLGIQRHSVKLVMVVHNPWDMCYCAQPRPRHRGPCAFIASQAALWIGSLVAFPGAVCGQVWSE
jgi:hypothetical protein